MDIIEFKKELHQQCKRIIEDRIAVAQSAMEAAQQSANNEEKSTAGDKYDTARAMGHIDRNMNARQLAEALDTLDLLNRVEIKTVYKTIQPGAVVLTLAGNYFVAVGAGVVNLNNEPYFSVSPMSPVAQALMGKKVGDIVKFNGRELKITQIY